MLEQLYTLTEEHTKAVTALVGFLSLLVPGWRKKVDAWFRALQRWAAKDRIEFETTTRSHMAETSEKLDHFVNRYKEDSQRWDGGLDKLRGIQAILENGISHKLAILAAQHRQGMEAEIRPMFVCDESGGNLMSSQGYLNLIGLSDHDDLSDAQWQMIICGDLKESYLSDFALAKRDKITLKSVVDFQNPNTGEHRGQWRVIAPCSQVNEALIFTGSFIPVDDKARQIAEEYGWN